MSERFLQQLLDARRAKKHGAQEVWACCLVL
jgi:hypothetical protein